MEIYNKIKTQILHPYISKKITSLEKMTLFNSYDTSSIVKDINVNCKNENNAAKEHVFKDTEMFMSFDGTSENTIISKFNRYLKGSEHLLQNLLSHPITNTDILINRQCYYKLLTDNNLDKTHIHTLFDKCKSLENDVIWLLAEKDENMKDLFDIIYFKWWIFKPCNNSSHILTSTIFYKILLSPIIGILTPIVYVIIPYLIMRIKFKFKIGFVEYVKIMFSTMFTDDSILFSTYGTKLKWLNRVSYLMSILFYFQGIFNSFELSKTHYKVSKYIYDKIHSLSEFINTSNELFNVLWNDNIRYFYNIEHINIQTIPITFQKRNFNIFTNFGDELKSFKNLDITILRNILKRIYILDSLYAVYQFKQNMQCTDTIYKSDSKPYIKIKSVWHPCIDMNKVIKNDLEISNNENAIITGPNAGGKSTFIKSLLVNILLSQTVGFTLSIECIHTPFDVIHSQINLPDNKGYESLFEAEMYRCKDVLDTLKMSPNKCYFIVMDEIFNSTNPIEGISGAYAVVKKISEYTNTLMLFTTHYTYLTKLEKQTNKFKALRMNIERLNNKIKYPYKLERGVSKQYIALELLKNNGFDADIIDDAMKLKNKFIS